VGYDLYELREPLQRRYQNLLIKADLSIKPVKWIDEVLDLALQFPPTPLLVDEGELGGDSVKEVSGNGAVSTH